MSLRRPPKRLPLKARVIVRHLDDGWRPGRSIRGLVRAARRRECDAALAEQLELIDDPAFSFLDSLDAYLYDIDCMWCLDDGACAGCGPSEGPEPLRASLLELMAA